MSGRQGVMSSNLTISTVVRLKSMATKVDVSRKRNSAVLRKQNMPVLVFSKLCLMHESASVYIENCIENKQKMLMKDRERSDEPKRNAKIESEVSRTSGYLI